MKRLFPRYPTHLSDEELYQTIRGYETEALPASGEKLKGPSTPDILRKGIAHMEDRAAAYDRPEGKRSMAATVLAFNVLTGHTLTETQGWQLVVLLKLCRANHGRFKLDNFEDAAAYCGPGRRCRREGNQRSDRSEVIFPDLLGHPTGGSLLPNRHNMSVFFTLQE